MITEQSKGTTMRVVARDLAVLIAAGMLLASCSTLRREEAVCFNTTPAVQIALPPPADWSAEKAGRFVGLRYTVQGDGAVQLFRTFEYRRGHLGVQTVDAEKEIWVDGKKLEQGREIHSVEEGSPAERAGLVVGDVIATVDGEPLVGQEYFELVIRKHDTAKPLGMQLFRDGRLTEVEALLEQRPFAEEDIASLRVPVVEETRHSGLTLGTVTAELAPYFGETARHGVLVLDILAGSPAFYSDLRVGDIIVRAVGSEQSAREDLGGAGTGEVRAEALAELMQLAVGEGAEVSLTLLRGERQMQASFYPDSDLDSSPSAAFPLVFHYDQKCEETKFNLILGGLLTNYERNSCFDSEANPFETWEFGAFLNLIHMRSVKGSRQYAILWFLRFGS